MEKLIDKIKDLFFVITHPSYWIMLNVYDERYDKWFNELLKKEKFSELGDYTVKLGEKEFWVANIPYSCFTTYSFDREVIRGSIRPSRRTIHKALKKLKDYRVSLEIENHLS